MYFYKLQPFSDLTFIIYSGVKCVTQEETDRPNGNQTAWRCHQLSMKLMKQKYMSQEKCEEVDGKIIADDTQ